MEKKLIIFDFDDTLTDNSQRDFQSYQYIIKKFYLKSISKNELINFREKSKTSEFIIKKIMNSDDEKLYNKYYQNRLVFLEKNSSYENFVKLKFCTLEILNKLKNDKYILTLNSIQSDHKNFLNILEKLQEIQMQIYGHYNLIQMTNIKQKTKYIPLITLVECQLEHMKILKKISN